MGPLIGLALLWLFAANPQTPTASDYTTIFLFASVPALLAMLVLIFGVKETRRPAARVNAVEETEEAAATGAANSAGAPAAPGGKGARLTLRGFDSNFKWFLVLVALFTLSNSTDAFLIRRAQMAGVSTGQGTLLLWSALHLSKVLSSIVGGDLSDRLGRKTLIVAGWLLYALVYLGFSRVSTAGEAWALFLIYGVYFGLAEGAEKALVADLVRPEQRGTAYGLYNLAFGITVLPASLLMGALWDWRGPATAFVVSAAIGTAAALLLVFAVRPARSGRQK
jgi:Na+/melibiose symporter-like transporter